MSNTNIKELTDANFDEEVLKNDLPVLVDFWAEWCGPCKMLGQILEKIAGDYSGRVVIGKLNVDQNNATAAKYKVTSLPTLLFVKDGKIAEQHTGLLSEKSLKGKIAEIFAL